MNPTIVSAWLRRALSLAALAAPTSLVLAACATDATDGPVTLTPAQAGRELAQRECASCHSIAPLGGGPRGGAMGESESDIPPPLREVLDRYSPNRLEMAFKEGMVVGHLNMPVYRLTDEETEALLAYLQSIRR